MCKRIISLILCIAMTILCIPSFVNAEEITCYQVLIDAGNGVQKEKAIINNNEIYIAATSFSKYTRFEFDDETKTFLVKDQEFEKVFKKVTVNAETKKVAVGTKVIELDNAFVLEETVYLPFCQMLPILNADIIEVDSGVIYVVNNKLSMAELLYDFNINDYRFDASEEFFGRTELFYGYVAPSYLFDTVVNFRFDRLDVIFESGTCEDYKTIFTDYLKDDHLFNEAMSEENNLGELLGIIHDLNTVTEKFDDVYDWFDKVEEIEYNPLKSDKLVQFLQKTSVNSKFSDEFEEIVGAIHDDVVLDKVSVADFFEGINYLYAYLNQIKDHQKMLDAVYGISKKQDGDSGASVSFTSVNPEYLAAEQIYELYTGDIIPAITKKTTTDFFEKLFEDVVSVKTLGIYNITADLAGEILELYLPGDSDNRALLPLHCNIVNSSMRQAAVPTLETEESTEKYRLSLLLTLLSSRACYNIMAETAVGYGYDATYYQHKIEKIENMIKGLYLVAQNAAFDTYENYEVFAKLNKDIIKEEGILEDPVEYISFEKELFDETCWTWTKGVTAGSAYVVLFHLDGTLHYYKMNEQILGYANYKYMDGILTIDDIEYTWEKDHFVSTEEFNVHMSSDPENFTLYPDNQFRFYQFVPSFSKAKFVEELNVKYGLASQTKFVSCIGGEIQKYPSSINGIITEIAIDLNNDNINERLVFVSKDQAIFLQIYSESSEKYILSKEEYITSLGYCSQQKLSLFFSAKANSYLLFVDRNISGAYTGIDGYFAMLYSVTPTSIELYASVNEVDYITEKGEIPILLHELEVPYAENCALINNITPQSQYIELLEIKHEFFNKDPMGGWADREHYLQLLLSKEQ